MYSHFLWLQDSDMQRLADALRDGAYFWMDAGGSTPWIGCPPYCCFWVLFFNFGVHLLCLCQMIAQGCNPPTPATAPRQCRITVLVPGLPVLNASHGLQAEVSSGGGMCPWASIWSLNEGGHPIPKLAQKDNYRWNNVSIKFHKSCRWAATRLSTPQYVGNVRLSLVSHWA